MGQFRFVVPTESLKSLRMWDAAYVCGIEGVPWEGRVTLENGILTVSRAVDDSGRLYIPYPIGADGPLMTLSTCSLREIGSERKSIGQSAPHILPLELARGECFRLRSQTDTWLRAGLHIDADLQSKLDNATEAFLHAASVRGSIDEVGKVSNRAIEIVFAAGEALATCYFNQAVAFRKQNERQLNTLLGVVANTESLRTAIRGGEFETSFDAAFNTVGIPVGWGATATDAGKVDFEKFDSLFEWAAAKGLKTIAGPLFDFHAKMLPEWLYLYEDDFQGLVESVETYVERAVMRYNGRVTLWHATAGLNTRGPISLDEEQVMRLAVAVIHTIRRIDPKTPVLISVDQPWGEYLGSEREGISPIHFADALIRSNLGVGGIGLELRMNYAQGGSLPRSLLDFGQQIDRWSTLGLPLLIQMSAPAGMGADPKAVRCGEIIPLGAAKQTTPQMQANMAVRWIRTMIAKGVVHGVMWEGWDDRVTHWSPHSGLIDANGQPRPLLEYLTKLKQELLT